MPVMPTSRGSRLARRRGFSLIELLITLVVLGVVGSALTTAIVRQQRINTRTVALIDTRNQGRVAVGALAQELRGISSAGSDIVAGEMTATRLGAWVPIGTSVVCALAGTTITIPTQRTLSTGPVLTSFVDPQSPPRIGDRVFLFDPSIPSTAPWVQRTVSNAGTSTVGAACPSGAGRLVPAADDGLQDYNVDLIAAPGGSVGVGSAVRFARRVRYEAKAAADGRTYLYYTECTAVGCGTEQQLSGPFLATSADLATTGFRFRYYDANGLETATPADVARIDIIARPVSRDRVSTGASGTRSNFTHEERVSIAVRNRI